MEAIFAAIIGAIGGIIAAIITKEKESWSIKVCVIVIAILVGIFIGAIGSMIVIKVMSGDKVKPPLPSKNSDVSVSEYLSSGRIDTPRDGDFVFRAFESRGTIENLPSEHYLWLAVGHSNLSWPKGPIEVIGNQWSGMVYEGGMPPGGKFKLSLYLVNSTGNQNILNWLKSGERSGYYPGLLKIEGGRLLHTINLNLEKED